MSRTKRVPPSFHAVRDLIEHSLANYPIPLRVYGLMKVITRNGFTRSQARQVMDHLVKFGHAEYIIKDGEVCIQPTNPESKGGEV